MLIKKGFAWAVVDEVGKLVEEDDAYCVYTTKGKANIECRKNDNERVVKVKIEVIK